MVQVELALLNVCAFHPLYAYIVGTGDSTTAIATEAPKNLMTPPTSAGKHRRGKSVLDRMKGLEGLPMGMGMLGGGGLAAPKPGGGHKRCAFVFVIFLLYNVLMVYSASGD